MKKVLTLLLVISMLFAVVIPSFAEEDYKVCFVCKAPADYFTAVMNGCQQAADEAGIKIDFFLPEKESAEMQVTLVQEAVIAGYDAIVLAPIDLNRWHLPARKNHRNCCLDGCIGSLRRYRWFCSSGSFLREMERKCY